MHIMLHLFMPLYFFTFGKCSSLTHAVDVMIDHPEDLWPFIWDCCCILFLTVSLQATGRGVWIAKSWVRHALNREM